MKKEKYLTLEEKIKIENQCFVLLPDVLTPEERAKIPYMPEEEKNKFFFNVVLPRSKKIINEKNS